MFMVRSAFEIRFNFLLVVGRRLLQILGRFPLFGHVLQAEVSCRVHEYPCGPFCHGSHNLRTL